MMSWMAILGLLGVVVLIVLVAAGVYLGIRLARPGLETSSARALLERRLAAGEIDVDEYYEREGALPGKQRRTDT
ncbi:MAG: SHOCT domain-containing protein [Thermoleophilaceae bacterium]|nr:SHOCT domain-containing protein [Thermoleophilaceae bacterium]